MRNKCKHNHCHITGISQNAIQRELGERAVGAQRIGKQYSGVRIQQLNPAFKLHDAQTCERSAAQQATQRGHHLWSQCAIMEVQHGEMMRQRSRNH